MAEFLHDLNIHGAGQIQFKTTAGANAGKIDQDGNNLVLTNAVGDILLGDGSSDVYIGDGTNNVDIIFEQSGSIKGDGSAVTLTLGGANTTLNLENPNFTGNITMPSKLTFTTTNGYILFDYEPSGDSGAYEGTTSVPLIKVDKNGTELTILERVSDNGGILLGNDDSVIIAGGDTRSTLRSNINEADETVIVSAEGGMKVIGFPDNLSGGWSARQEFRFYTGGSDASSNGLWIGSGGNTQFIDLNRNLKNIGTIAASGSITLGGNNPTLTLNDSDGRAAAIDVVGNTFRIDDVDNNAAIFTADLSTNPVQTTFAGPLSAGSYSLTAGSLDINGNADIAGELQVTTNGTATLILRGDNNNSGDTGQLDSAIKMLHDDGTHGILMETKNYAGKQSFEIKSLAAGTESSRLLIHQDNYITTSGDILPQTDNSKDLGSSTKRWQNVVAVNLHGDGSNITGITATDSTKLPLAGGTMSGDIAMGNNDITGVKFIQANGNVDIRTGSGEYALHATQDGQTSLYHNGVKKFETTSVGIDVVGEVQGDSLDIDGAADIAGKLVINTNSDDILTLNQSTSGTKWNYINFNQNGTREWFIGQDTDGNFDIYNDVIDAYAITINRSNNSILLNDTVSIAQALTVVSGDINLSAGNVVVGSQYGIRFNDANTRIYTNTDSPEDLLVEADQDILLTPDRYVGVNTTAPSSVLHVNTGSGTNNANTVIIDRAGSSDYSGISFATAGTVDWSIGQNSAGAFEVFEDGLDSKTRLTIANGGNATFAGDVTIGSTSSTKALKLPNNGEIQLFNSNDDNKFTIRNIGSAQNTFAIETNDGTDALTISSTGTTTVSNLTVTGNLSITGDIDSYNVNNLDVVDKLITIGVGQTEANSNGSGILVDGSNASLLWDETNNTWDFNKSLDVVGNGTFSGDITLDDNSGASPSIYLKNGNNNFWRLFCGSSEDLTFRLGTVTKFEIDSSGNADFAGDVSLPANSTLNFSTDIDLVHSADTLLFQQGGSDRFRITGDVHVRGATDFAIPAGRKLYLDGQSNTYITESSADTIKIFTGGSEVLQLSNNGATFAGDIIINRSSVLGTAKLTIQADAGEDVFGVQCNSNDTTTKLINIFNSSGTDIASITINNDSTPDMLFNVDDGSGTITEVLKLDSSQNATFAGDITIGKAASSASSGSKSLTFKGVDDNGTEIVAAKILTVDSANNPQGQDLNIQVASDNSTLFTIMQLNSSGFIGLGVTGGSINNHLHLADNYSLGLGTGSDLTLLHNGTNSFIINETGNLTIRNRADDSDIIFECDNGSGATTEYFKLDGSATNMKVSKDMRFLDTVNVQLGDGADFTMQHNGTSTVFQNLTGDLKIVNSADDKDIIFQSDDGSGGVTSYFELDGSAVVTKFRKHLYLLDDVALKIGNSYDLDIKHDGTDSYISNGTGNLYIINGADDQDIIFKSDDGNNGTAEYFRLDGGIVRNVFSKNVGLEDNIQLIIGSGNDLQILHDASDSFLINNTGDLYLRNLADDKDIIFQSDDGSGGVAEYFKLDGSAVFTRFSKDARFSDSVKAEFGDSGDGDIYHDGTDFRIENSTGDILIQNFTNDKDIKFLSDDGSGGTATYFMLDGSLTLNRFLKSTLYNDNVRALFGTDSDLQIYHSGSSAIMYNSTGNITFTNYADDSDIIFQSDNGSGGVTEYFRVDGGATKTIASKAFQFFDNVKAEFGDSSDLQIFHDGNSKIQHSGAGILAIKSADTRIQNAAGTENMAKFTQDGAVELYYNNSKRFETTSSGISVTNGITLGGTVQGRTIPYVIHTGWGDDTSTTANKIIPLGNSVTEQNVSAADGQHFFVAPYAGSVKKIIMKNVAGTLSSSFTTELKLYINGANVTSSGELTASSNAITWEPSSSNTFNPADTISLVYQKSASSKYWREVALTMVLTMNGQDI